MVTDEDTKGSIINLVPTENRSRVAATPPVMDPNCRLTTHKSIETLGMITGEGTLDGSIERKKQGNNETKELLELPTLSRQNAPVTQDPRNSTNQSL